MKKLDKEIQKDKEELKFTCPYCGNEQIEIGEKLKGDKWYAYDLEEKSWRVWYEFDGMIEEYFCLACDEVLSLDDLNEILPEKAKEDLNIKTQ